MKCVLLSSWISSAAARFVGIWSSKPMLAHGESSSAFTNYIPKRESFSFFNVGSVKRFDNKSSDFLAFQIHRFGSNREKAKTINSTKLVQGV
jgi:hypothetical protein